MVRVCLLIRACACGCVSVQTGVGFEEESFKPLLPLKGVYNQRLDGNSDCNIEVSNQYRKQKRNRNIYI